MRSNPTMIHRSDKQNSPKANRATCAFAGAASMVRRRESRARFGQWLPTSARNNRRNQERPMFTGLHKSHAHRQVVGNGERRIHPCQHGSSPHQKSLTRGLGGRFVRALRRRFDDILRNPEFFRPVGRRSIRKARLLHWPHSIFFRILPDEVRIISVWHGSRDPRELNHRLR